MTASCQQCRREIMIASAREHCRDGVVVGYTCGETMRRSCAKLSGERRDRPWRFSPLKRMARKALDDQKRDTAQ